MDQDISKVQIKVRLHLIVRPTYPSETRQVTNYTRKSVRQTCSHYEPRTLTTLRSIKVQSVTRCFSPFHTKASEGHLLGRHLNQAIKETLDKAM